MLKSICGRCGAEIPYHTRCTCRTVHKQRYDKRYDKTQRDKTSTAIYHSKEWADVREVAMARDHGLCLSCLANSKFKACDTVHHIVEIKEDSGKAYDTDNLISLCFKCHHKVHKVYEVSKEAEQERLSGLIGEE